MNKKLKVAIGTDAFPPTTDGISNVAQSYAEIINRDLGEAVVVTPKNPNAQDDKYSYKIYRYKSWYVPSSEGYSIGWPFKDELHMDIINMNFDLLHSHAPLATSYYFRRVVEKKKIPVVLTYHTKYEYDIEKRIPTRALKNFSYRFLLNNVNSADEVWVTSEGTGESLRKIGYTGDYIVMPNGCDLPKTNFSDEQIDALKDKLGIEKNIPILIYVGRMIWYKNIELIIESCKKLADDGEDFRLIMLGFGTDEKAIRRSIKRARLLDKVIWAGKVLDRGALLEYYAVSDLLLFPSVFDTNGLVVRESASCGTPSLLIRDSCASEGIEDRETGFLCMESPHSIASVVESIMHDKELLRTVGKNAQDKIYISWQDAVKRAYDRYQIVIDNFNEKNLK